MKIAINDPFVLKLISSQFEYTNNCIIISDGPYLSPYIRNAALSPGQYAKNTARQVSLIRPNIKYWLLEACGQKILQTAVQVDKMLLHSLLKQ